MLRRWANMIAPGEALKDGRWKIEDFWISTVFWSLFVKMKHWRILKYETSSSPYICSISICFCWHHPLRPFSLNPTPPQILLLHIYRHRPPTSLERNQSLHMQHVAVLHFAEGLKIDTRTHETVPCGYIKTFGVGKTSQNVPRTWVRCPFLYHKKIKSLRRDSLAVTNLTLDTFAVPMFWGSHTSEFEDSNCKRSRWGWLSHYVPKKVNMNSVSKMRGCN